MKDPEPILYPTGLVGELLAAVWRKRHTGIIDLPPSRYELDGFEFSVRVDEDGLLRVARRRTAERIAEDKHALEKSAARLKKTGESGARKAADELAVAESLDAEDWIVRLIDPAQTPELVLIPF